ncbi:hypothetical protein OSTOST_12446, partial [Ostertagia ostertagi]
MDHLSVKAVRWALLTSLVMFLLGMALLMTLSMMSEQQKPQMQIVKKSRIFPQGGDNVKFDQPWELTKPDVISDISFFDRSTESYLVSNFSYSKGMGNLMFQYASLRSLANKWKSTLVVPVTTTLRCLLESGKVPSEDHNCCKFVSIPEPTNQRLTAVTGYLQNPRYFTPDNEAVICKEFDFLPAIQEQ